MGTIFKIGLAIIGLFAFSKVAHAASSSASTRQRVVSKSGRVWFTSIIPGNDPGSVNVQIFASATGSDMVLSYNQVIETQQRFLVYQAPSTLGQQAAVDFI